jgi:hypothetical protein
MYLLGALDGQGVIETNVSLLFNGELFSGHRNVCCQSKKKKKKD